GRIAAQSAKQVIVQKVRDAERDRQYEEFKDRIGEIVNGQVKRVEYGNVIVDLGRGEGIVRRDELIPRETFRYGDRVRAYVYDVRLASQLTGWDIDILTEQEESERRQKEFQERSALFIAALDVDEVVGQLLASEGFATVEEIAFVDLEDLAAIEGFDEETAGEL